MAVREDKGAWPPRLVLSTDRHRVGRPQPLPSPYYYLIFMTVIIVLARSPALRRHTVPTCVEPGAWWSSGRGGGCLCLQKGSLGRPLRLALLDPASEGARGPAQDSVTKELWDFLQSLHPRHSPQRPGGLAHFPSPQKAANLLWEGQLSALQAWPLWASAATVPLCHHSVGATETGHKGVGVAGCQ